MWVAFSLVLGDFFYQIRAIQIVDIIAGTWTCCDSCWAIFFYQIRVVLVVGTVAGAWVVVVAAVWFSLRAGRSLFHQIQTLRFPHV